jgi:hypothetical protein
LFLFPWSWEEISRFWLHRRRKHASVLNPPELSPAHSRDLPFVEMLLVGPLPASSSEWPASLQPWLCKWKCMSSNRTDVLWYFKNHQSALCDISLSSFLAINLKKITQSLIAILQKTQSVSFHG